MADLYPSMTALYATEPKANWSRTIRNINSTVLVAAPHGGGIEVRTTDVANGIASDVYKYFSFNGLLKSQGYQELHVTSTNYDCPYFKALNDKVDYTYTIHGCSGTTPIAYVGGLDTEAGVNLMNHLRKAGFKTGLPPAKYAGTSTRNICNKNRRRKGVQVELTRSLRDSLVSNGKYTSTYYALISAFKAHIIDFTGQGANTIPKDKQGVIDFLAPLVQKYDEVGGMFPSVKIAQIIQETGWLTSDLYKYANNPAGMKFSAPYSTKYPNMYYEKTSPEWDSAGNKYYKVSKFRKYNTVEDGIKDMAGFYTSTSWRTDFYKAALTATTPQAQAKALSNTWATDPKYGEQLIVLMNDYDLYRYDTTGGDVTPIDPDQDTVPIPEIPVDPTPVDPKPGDPVKPPDKPIEETDPGDDEWGETSPDIPIDPVEPPTSTFPTESVEINVSAAWQANQRQALSEEGFVEVEMDIGYSGDDPNAIVDDTFYDYSYLSNPQHAVNLVDPPPPDNHATLEQNHWILDGSMEVVDPIHFKQSGSINDDVGSSDGIMSGGLMIHYDYMVTEKIPGISIVWSERYQEYATQFTVVVGDDKGEILRKEVTDNTTIQSDVQFTIPNSVKGFTWIEVRVHTWCLPYKRVRIDKLFLGIHRKYTKNEIVNYSYSSSNDPMMNSNPTEEIVVEVDNSDRFFAYSNPNSLIHSTRHLQKVRVRYGFKLGKNIEWIPGGVFFLEKVSAPENGITATIRATDYLRWMDGDVGIVGHWGDSVWSLIGILNAPNIDRKMFMLNMTDLQPFAKPITPVIQHIPLKDFLRLLAQMNGFKLFFTRDGHINLVNGLEWKGHRVYRSQCYERPNLEVNKQVKAVTVEWYQWIKDGVKERMVDDTIIPDQDGFHFVKFNKTMHHENFDIKVTPDPGYFLGLADPYNYGIGSDGAYFNLKKGIKYRVIVDGYPAKKITNTVTKTTGLSEGDTIVVKNPLVATARDALGLAKRLVRPLKAKSTMSVDYRFDPKIETNTYLYVEVEDLLMMLEQTNVNIKFSGAFKGTSKGLVIGQSTLGGTNASVRSAEATEDQA